MGMGKYVDEEQLIELLPGMEDDIKAACDSSGELTSNSDRDAKWFQSAGDFKQVRLVDVWYKSKGGWKWALFTGSKILMAGESPFVDEYEKQFCKYLMFSAQVDHEGDRYGFPRNLQSAQDEVNQRRSRGCLSRATAASSPPRRRWLTATSRHCAARRRAATASCWSTRRSMISALTIRPNKPR